MVQNKKKRKLNPYEKNLLMRFGYDTEFVEIQIPYNMPVEYYIAKAEFCGEFFEVNQSVLIPRVETEEIIDLCLEEIKKKQEYKDKKKLNLLEIGTGSGCISITLAKKLRELNKKFQITAVDTSVEALQIAKINCAKILNEDAENLEKVNFVQSNLLESLQNDKFDLIVSNPPYIPSKRIDILDPSVSSYEPIVALDGGRDGFSLLYKLLMQSTRYLHPKGAVILEVDDTHTERFLRQNYPKLFEIWDLNFKKDENGNNRFIIAKRKNT